MGNLLLAAVHLNAPRHRPTTNIPAYEAYLRGMELVHAADPDGGGPLVENLERAVALDPDFALARAWLSYPRPALRVGQ